jgi:O-antigen ligase
LQGNPTSTFGNLDYYSAYIGTSFPLLAFVFLKSGSLGKKLIIALGVLSLICLRLTDAKQGYVDVLIVATASILYVTYIKFRREQDPDRERYSLGVRTTIYTFLLFVWLEIIFVTPFIGKSIPFVGDDPQVAIRGVLWMAGINQFNSEQLLGVGPDQYGSYYEKFRTVNSTIVLPSDSVRPAKNLLRVGGSVLCAASMLESVMPPPIVAPIHLR